MKKLPSVLILVASLFVAAALTWSIPADPLSYNVNSAIGRPVALEDAMSVVVTDVALTRELTDTVERRTELVYLVVDIDVFITGEASTWLHLLASSHGATFEPGGHSLGLPRGTEPGYVSHLRVPVLMDEAHLEGAKIEFSATGGLVVGFHRVAVIDLGLDQARVEELLVDVDIPIAIPYAEAEVIR